MAIGMNVGAFRGLFMEVMDRLDRLERTPEGRAELAAEARAQAKELRARAAGGSLNRDAGGERNTRVASEAELSRRALERARELEKRAADLDAIKGIHEPWAAFQKGGR